MFWLSNPWRAGLGLLIVASNRNGPKWPDPFWPAARVGRAKMGQARLFPTSRLQLFIRDFLHSPLKLVNIDLPFPACYHSHETCCDTIPLSSHLQVEGLKLMLENCKVAEYY